jgi:hypothetical protein
MKTYGGVDVKVFLPSALHVGGWLASHPGHYTPRGRAPGIHWIGGWVGPRAGLRTCGKEKNILPIPGIKLLSLRRPAHSPLC